ncbi:hypothetical protein KYC_09756 [Achromobacter arsenitoxydans SY8]|uniref:Tlde1 domain-containing protein n=2 Tax=Achromobacter TaxID=222 RepID=H0F5A8_9BURK|nr:hypothetical protein KYC_09756 [Achromobacter arsenitoxydans SY8]
MFEWDFLLNSQPMSKLKGRGLSVDAFSGREGHFNECESACLRNVGPIPAGKYYIVDRPSGGLRGAVNTWVGGRWDWFALFAQDSKVDDWVFCREVERGNFRLHPKGRRGISEGCITVERESDFTAVRKILLKSEGASIPGSSLKAYGIVNVRCARAS